MELIIFQPGEVYLELFKNNEVNININVKNEKFGDFLELDYTKSKLEELDSSLECIRRAAAKYYHEYELIKVICKKTVVSRAYFKIYELIYFNDIIKMDNLNCLFLCEAPGGFIDAILDIRRFPNFKTNYLTISKKENIDSINYNRYIDKNNILYGDITDINVINNTIEKSLVLFPDKLELITADGGFDVKNYNSQEILVFPLILSEIIIALSTQKTHGTFIIKFFDMFTHNTVIVYLILCACYSEVKIIKPLTSRESNSERYLVCKDFIKVNENIIDSLKNFLKDKNTLYSNFDFEKIPKISNLKIINNMISANQIRSINKSIELVNKRDIFFINIILTIFNGSFKLVNLYKYNNILTERIKKAVIWLKKYSLHNINVNY
jgi:23S rRNA U2552 (ribose-2'-O)-methylase RlmE/FtsJ